MKIVALLTIKVNVIMIPHQKIEALVNFNFILLIKIINDQSHM